MKLPVLNSGFMLYNLLYSDPLSSPHNHPSLNNDPLPVSPTILLVSTMILSHFLPQSS